MSMRIEHRLRLREKEFAGLLGFSTCQLMPAVKHAIRETDFSYEILYGPEKERVVVDILQKIDSGELTLAGEKSRWDVGWGEAFKDYLNSGDINDLTPKYIRPGKPLRLCQNLIIPKDPLFELNWYNIFRRFIFDTWFAIADNVYEFGCGTGHNLFALAKIHPDKKLFGLDWTTASSTIISEVRRRTGWDVTGRQFDFFNPDYDFKLQVKSAVFTLGALEQTGMDYVPFIEYLLAQKPQICVHIEPIIEWYDPNDLVDYTGIRFLEERCYWSGFPGYMYELRDKGLIEILHEKRTFFGSLFIEGYSQFVWKPK